MICTNLGCFSIRGFYTQRIYITFKEKTEIAFEMKVSLSHSKKFQAVAASSLFAETRLVWKKSRTAVSLRVDLQAAKVAAPSLPPASVAERVTSATSTVVLAMRDFREERGKTETMRRADRQLDMDFTI